MVSYHHEVMNTFDKREYTEKILNNPKLITSETNLNLNFLQNFEKYDINTHLKLLHKDSIESI